ncbi:hypothetical protein [Brucella intermedia]|uniref:hypothetical protein n=1 Tax=Brucella intermedia TaxID=94625 RepID=UPI00124E6AE2|nr:hypothetical protein [Brucella intermedia]KAB2732218.1 hypothetical protein F9L02_05355 [Brucella intermedia]
MIGLGECRSANVDGLPWQLRLLPTGYCNVRGETERFRAGGRGSASAASGSFRSFFGRRT